MIIYNKYGKHNNKNCKMYLITEYMSFSIINLTKFIYNSFD